MAQVMELWTSARIQDVQAELFFFLFYKLWGRSHLFFNFFSKWFEHLGVPSPRKQQKQNRRYSRKLARMRLHFDPCVFKNLVIFFAVIDLHFRGENFFDKFPTKS